MHLGLIGSEGKTAPGSDAPQPRLVRAAREFEGQMMKELLKPMMDSEGFAGKEADGVMGSGSGALGEFATEALGQGLSQQGGFGMADRIVAQLSHSGNARQMAEK